jgi:type I restriction enzyme M protein
MLSPYIKKKVDKLWDRFWAAGLTNPLVAIEQITYLLFLKRLEDLDLERQKKGLPSLYEGNEKCKWSYIRLEKTNVDHLVTEVFPWLRKLDARIAKDSRENSELASLGGRMEDAYFQLDRNKGQVLGDAIDTIDELFARAGQGSAAQDVMGDVFEYLLSEIASAGKNGQFRTPRHIIRFMVELLDPEPGQRIVDPAAGTGGFLFSAQQYLLRKHTPEKNLRIEWDGAPHRMDGSATTREEYAAIHNGALYVGLDNDRTMARIGWMNLVLHGLENPHIFQGDSLSRREGKPLLPDLLKSETYDLVLANPPFTGTVDSDDLEPDSLLFPRAAERGKKAKEALTNKSELLFVWLMLDLLNIGGRCAVIVPEGVLFGNTDAHIRLRRELLTEHVVEGIISLPGGVFQPYTGVKTSILVFRKETGRDDKQRWKGQKPRTESVWFYEVEADGYSLDAKRNAQPGKDSDLWDALAKFKARYRGGEPGEKTYFQPRTWKERWRMVDSTLENLYPENIEVKDWLGKVAAIHELFPDAWDIPYKAYDLPAIATEQTVTHAISPLALAARIALYPAAAIIQKEIANSTKVNAPYPGKEEILKLAEKPMKKAKSEFLQACRKLKSCFDSEESQGWPLFEWAAKDKINQQEGLYLYHLQQGFGELKPPVSEGNDDWKTKLKKIALEYAKLDGFDVTLRSPTLDTHENALKTAKHWIIKVREYARNDEWVSEDGRLTGSHDEAGRIHPEYVSANPIYDDEGKLLDGVLDPDCIEARDWNLSAGQYKPFDFTQLRSEKSVVELIRDLQQAERRILAGLNKLLAMAEGRE